MAVNRAKGGYELPCERDLEQVWDRLDEVEAGRADQHELTCPHCRTARESLRALRDATRELADHDEPPPEGLTSRIMSAVRAEMRRGHMVSLPTPEPGKLEVSEQAVAVVLRYAADAVDGVRGRRCRVRTVGLGELGESLVEVELAVAVSYRNVDADRALSEVRERVGAAAAARVGLRLVRLDLLVDDIYDDQETE
ncbi:anti-sigma factor family protein [Amycolatopsis anabasis]|uniref:anti-sigma factor family protein n=1 Tax=Amycolatopsis anabasis TaxID=1840409 RepID=UPI00131CFA49|nr:Asp23/Gls24 family envelope stress response protein [Amycolatopsis anabasis]